MSCFLDPWTCCSLDLSSSTIRIITSNYSNTSTIVEFSRWSKLSGRRWVGRGNQSCQWWRVGWQHRPLERRQVGRRNQLCKYACSMSVSTDNTSKVEATDWDKGRKSHRRRNTYFNLNYHVCICLMHTHSFWLSCWNFCSISCRTTKLYDEIVCNSVCITNSKIQSGLLYAHRQNDDIEVGKFLFSRTKNQY